MRLAAGLGALGGRLLDEIAPERAAQTTAAPSRAKSRLIARPMPLLAPVMIATLPSSRPMRVLLLTVPQASPRPANPSRSSRFSTLPIALRGSSSTISHGGQPLRLAELRSLAQARMLVGVASRRRLAARRTPTGVSPHCSRRHADHRGFGDRRDARAAPPRGRSDRC